MRRKSGLHPSRGARIVGRVVVRWCRRSRSSTTGYTLRCLRHRFIKICRLWPLRVYTNSHGSPQRNNRRRSQNPPLLIHDGFTCCICMVIHKSHPGDRKTSVFLILNRRVSSLVIFFRNKHHDHRPITSPKWKCYQAWPLQ